MRVIPIVIPKNSKIYNENFLDYKEMNFYYPYLFSIIQTDTKPSYVHKKYKSRHGFTDKKINDKINLICNQANKTPEMFRTRHLNNPTIKYYKNNIYVV